MKDSFVKFQLIDLNRVKCMLFTSLPRTRDLKFTLFKEGEPPVKLHVIKSSSVNFISLFELALPSPYEFGKEYNISLLNFPTQPVDVSLATTFKEFDTLFNYYGDDLGATYYPDHTDFALWAPLASRVELRIEINGKDNYYRLKRTDKGVYRITLHGDLLNARYRYLVTNSGATIETTDPYGKGVSENSDFSGVVDIDFIKRMGEVKPTTPFNEYVDASIYEVGVRDFTEQKDSTDIKMKGKYLGFVEEGRKTKGGHKAGLDYLVDLGITHVQLNPVIDFGSVDDLNISKKYNWGYDPISFFALEGSYSLKPQVPMERLVEFKTMVNKLHEKNIRVIMDVVYNHIYEHVSSHFDKVVPNYFFRRSSVGLLSNACGCGDDFASEKFMARKMIVDSLAYFVDVFGVDGYRFDLMGLLDIMTVKRGYKKCKDIKPDIMMYGEGWNMGMELPYEQKACSDNAYQIPQFGFFNDSVRDILKGPTFRDAIHQKGYINGDPNYEYGLKYALFGGVLNLNYNARFEDANQSINYFECHDNNTVFDKLRFSNPDEEDDILLKRVLLGNAILSTSFGVAFYHMGQEIGLSKNGNDNTYNVLDINDMDWNLLDERYSMVEAFKRLMKLRKEFPLYTLHKREDLESAIELESKDGVFIYSCNKPELINGAEKLYVLYNPQNRSVPIDFNEDLTLKYGSNGATSTDKNKIVISFVTVPPVSMLMLIKEGKNA